jgi:hypothetical protein
MTGVEGLGQRSMVGRQGPDIPETAATLGRLGMQVTPENVLGVYGVLREEVLRLQTSVRRFLMTYGEGMPLLGGDPVSPHAAKGFTEATTQLVTKCQGQIAELKSVAKAVADAARAYGKSEQEIAAAFDTDKFMYTPTSVPPSPAAFPSSFKPLFDPRPSRTSPPGSAMGELLTGGHT